GRGAGDGHGWWRHYRGGRGNRVADPILVRHDQAHRIGAGGGVRMACGGLVAGSVVPEAPLIAEAGCRVDGARVGGTALEDTWKSRGCRVRTIGVGCWTGVGDGNRLGGGPAGLVLRGRYEGYDISSVVGRGEDRKSVV